MCAISRQMGFTFPRKDHRRRKRNITDSSKFGTFQFISSFKGEPRKIAKIHRRTSGNISKTNIKGRRDIRMYFCGHQNYDFCHFCEKYFVYVLYRPHFRTSLKSKKQGYLIDFCKSRRFCCFDLFLVCLVNILAEIDMYET